MTLDYCVNILVGRFNKLARHNHTYRGIGSSYKDKWQSHMLRLYVFLNHSASVSHCSAIILIFNISVMDASVHVCNERKGNLTNKGVELKQKTNHPNLKENKKEL